MAPIAPDPFVPEVSTPLNVMTVSDETVPCDSVAVTVALVNGEVANARQISLSPACTFVRTTNCHVSPPPVTPVTLVPPKSAATNASSSSLPDDVENDGLVTVVTEVDG